MSDDERANLRRRLARLGGTRPARPAVHIPQAGMVESPRAFSVESERQTAFGPAVVLEKVYPLETSHGHTRLAELLRLQPQRNTALTGLPADSAPEPSQLVFLDTETTGLAGGAGTLAFLIGAGFMRGDQFILRQYFLRSPREEPAMLSALQEDVGGDPVFVTYNGKTFDIPLLETRALVGLRQRWKLSASAHIDLLHLTRRMWRQTLPDCRLGTVEDHMLGVRRSGADIPGSEIPAIYLDYLQNGDMSGILRVCYHNEIDILSLAALLVQLDLRFRRELSQLSAGEVLALARWHDRLGEPAAASEALHTVLDDAEETIRIEARQRLAALLKRDGRFEDAVKHWQAWAQLAPEDPVPCIELAKYYEWQARDYVQAGRWTQQALVSLTHWPEGTRREAWWREVEHRQRRLSGKSGKDSTG